MLVTTLALATIVSRGEKDEAVEAADPQSDVLPGSERRSPVPDTTG